MNMYIVLVPQIDWDTDLRLLMVGFVLFCCYNLMEKVCLNPRMMKKKMI